jgi:hypothetical protein
MERGLRVPAVRALAACAAAASFALALACSEAETPEQQVRAVLAALEESAQQRDAGAMKEHVSDAYSDGNGNDKRTVSQLVAFHLLRNQSVHLLTRVQSLEIPAPAEAQASVLVAMAGTPIEGPDALLAMRADLYRFDLSFREEGGDWRIRSAEWRPAAAEDFR